MNSPTTGHNDLPRSRWRDVALFFRHWLRTPGVTGAMVPSSRAMARSITHVLDDYPEPVVVELGAGTGPVTAAIQQRSRGRARHLAVEIHPELAERLQGQFPDVEVINGSAADLEQQLSERGIDAVDVIISGLPFTAFTPKLQSQVLTAVERSLSDAGVFATFRYWGAGHFPAAKRFGDELRARFGELTTGPPIFGNLPPVCLLTARKPRRS
ncbi:MAG: class I SAM-dependent methyltransferase [Stackebrandtia sp.]